MLLFQRLQKMVSIAESTESTEDTFEAVKALLMFKAYNHEVDFGRELKKLEDLSLVNNCENRIKKLIQRKESFKDLQNQYLLYYKKVEDLAFEIKKIYDEELSGDSEYFKFLIWNFCYDWTNLNLLYNKLREDGDANTPNCIIDKFPLNDINLYKDYMKEHDKAWKKKKIENINFKLED